MLLALVASLFVVVGAQPAGATPNFQMPFPCGETWHASTYTNHGPSEYAVDWNLIGAQDNGKPVQAGVAGTATVQYQASGYGNYVDVNAGGGWVTRYAHLASVSVANGATVTALTQLGTVGDSGLNNGAYHLHYEQRLNGVVQAAVFNGSAITYVYSYSTPNPYTSANCSGSSDAVYGPAIAVNPSSGKATAVAQGPDHSLYAYWQTAVDGQWAGPLGLANGAPNKAYSDPAIAYNPVTDTFTVVAQGPSKSLYAYWQTSPNGQWAGPIGLNNGAANTAYSAPAITMNSSGLGTVVAQGPSNSLYAYWQTSVNGAWAGPIGIAGGAPNKAYSDPSAAINNSSGKTTVVTQGPSNSLYAFWQPASGWAGPLGIHGGAAGVAYSDPSVAMNQSSGKATVVVKGPSNSLRAYWQLATNGQWGGPIGLNNGAANTAYSDPAVAFNPNTGRAVAVAEGPSNSLYAYWQTAVDGQWAGPLGIAGGQGGIAF